ncbi:hypothetical protein F383_04185 [Gossypium arboreum]|uniref:Uncharacterized protein n=1 Tax=Gossypium arboreum TaxID=29729 RepID=A0A0B0N6D9_GOSAR|nr:hypothetical protein F383_04185 [Gossypium arboreum]
MHVLQIHHSSYERTDMSACKSLLGSIARSIWIKSEIRVTLSNCRLRHGRVSQSCVPYDYVTRPCVP